ncbi:MAG: radical SAM protein [Polyangiales bacterium]
MFLPARFSTALVRGARMLLEPTAPVLVQMVVTRRCNLTCGYCNEYDDVSDPIPTEVLKRQIDHVAALGTIVLTFTGGEPLLHPDLDKLIAYAVSKGLVVTSITNGYPVTRTWIQKLNAANLSFLQISIDNLEPNEVSQKSLSKIKKKLALLKEHATFGVNVNAVLGSSPPAATRELVDHIESLGFYMTVGLLHGPEGQLDAGLAGAELASLYREMRNRSKKTIFHYGGEGWEDAMIEGGTAPFKCRAGSRYLYVDEFGKVSYCSQRRGDPGIPLLEYGRDLMRQAFDAPKGCEASCTIACVRRASVYDGWRPQRGAPAQPPRDHTGKHLRIVT